MEFCRSTTDPDVLLVRVDRFLDFRNAEDLIEQCRDCLEDGTQGLLVVLEPGSVLDSAGLGALIRTYRRIEGPDAGPRLGLVNRSDHARTLLDITGLGDVIPQFDTVERGVEALSRSG